MWTRPSRARSMHGRFCWIPYLWTSFRLIECGTVFMPSPLIGMDRSEHEVYSPEFVGLRHSTLADNVRRASGPGGQHSISTCLFFDLHYLVDHGMLHTYGEVAAVRLGPRDTL